MERELDHVFICFPRTNPRRIGSFGLKYTSVLHTFKLMEQTSVQFNQELDVFTLYFKSVPCLWTIPNILEISVGLLSRSSPLCTCIHLAFMCRHALCMGSVRSNLSSNHEKLRGAKQNRGKVKIL